MWPILDATLTHWLESMTEEGKGLVHYSVQWLSS